MKTKTPVWYLAGPMFKASPQEKISWRVKITELFHFIRHETIIPPEDPFDGSSGKSLWAEAEALITGDMENIRRSTGVIAWFPEHLPGIGTKMEIFYAKRILNLPVFAWDGAWCGSPWFHGHIDMNFSSYPDVFEYIRVHQDALI